MKRFALILLVCLLALGLLAGAAGAKTPTLRQLARTVAALQKTVKTQATTIGALSSKLTAARQAIADQGASITTLSSKLTADETTITSQGSAISALQNAPASGISQAQFDTLSGKVTTAQGDITTLQTGLSSVWSTLGANASSGLRGTVETQGSDISALQTTVGGHTTTLTNAAPLLAIAPYVSLNASAMNGVKAPNIVFQGANVHVRSSSAENDTTGLGNLIVGWNTAPASPYRSGSNNLVIGTANNFTSYGGLVAGAYNTASGPCASVSGGYGNTASGSSASVSGGTNNTAGGNVSSVSGGGFNTVSGDFASVSGGGGPGTLSGLTVTADWGWKAGNATTPGNGTAKFIAP